MFKLKCPYCPEIRPTAERLSAHVHIMHLTVSEARRVRDLRFPREVEDVTVVGTELTVETKPNVPCVCGGAIEPMDESTEYPAWTHQVPMPKCREAIPAAGVPTKQDRAELMHSLSDAGKQMAKAGRDMADMRAALDSVDERMRKLDAQLVSPATVRRATLNQVWDRLLEAGDLAGASVVMKMINAVVDDA